MKAPQKILVIKLGALGDFIQALGSMAAIARHHPNADITLLTTEPFVTIGTECNYFHHIQVDEKPKWNHIKNWLSLKKKLNNGNFDRVYDLQNNDRTSFYLRLFKNNPEWVGIAKGASHRNTSPERTAGCAFDGHVQSLKLAGINDIAIDDMSWVKDNTDHFNIEKPYVLLAPGCSPKRPEKRWPEEHFGALARQLHGWGYNPVIIGTKNEEKIAAVICEIFPKTINLTGQTDLFDIVRLARYAAASIGNDTGPMHLIAQTGCPSYVLFSSHSNPVKHAPIGRHVHIIQKDDLNNLSPDHVMDKLSVRNFRKPDQTVEASEQ